MTSKFKTTLVLFLLVMPPLTQARTLSQILRAAVVSNPKLSEAHANERIAGSQLEQTAATRWPVVAASGGQRVVSSSSNGSGFSPALQGRWTIYDFGKNDAQIDSNLLKVDYFTNKTQETAEELIYEIAGYYLEALKSKNSLKVANGNLKRHHELVRMLKIIVKYDPGRRSELTQAKSRLLQVESDITSYQRSLGLSLLRIAPHIKPTVKAKEISDPFSDLKAKKLVAKYRTTEKDLQSHPSYLAQQKEMLRIAADLVVAKKARWPDINLVGSASTEEQSVYLNFDVDLFNRTIDPGVSEKRYEIQAAKAQLDQIQRNLDERAKLAELKMFQDQTRLYIANNQIKELAQVARDYEDQFSIAKRTLLDVVNAYRELANIELFKVNTRYDLMVAKLDYLSAVGSLRDWSGVSNDERHPLLIADTKIKTTKNVLPSKKDTSKGISLKALNAKSKKPLRKTKSYSAIPIRQLNKVATLASTKNTVTKQKKENKKNKTHVAINAPTAIELESFNGAMVSITNYAKSKSRKSNSSLKQSEKSKKSELKVTTSANKKNTGWTKKAIGSRISTKLTRTKSLRKTYTQPEIDIDLESLAEISNDTVWTHNTLTKAPREVKKAPKSIFTKEIALESMNPVRSKTKQIEKISTRLADSKTREIIKKAERSIFNERVKKTTFQPSDEIFDIEIDLESANEETDLELINLESLDN